MLYLVIFFTVAPLLIYFLVGISHGSRAKNVEDYFVYSQEVSAEDYANTSVGYALQMASVFLFVEWGMRYGLGALWTPVFWALGFLFLYWLLPKFKSFHESRSTLHQFLRHQFQDSRLIQSMAAVATIVGLWGVMMAEVDYTITLYTAVPVFRDHLDLLFYFFLTFGTLYIVLNGYKAEIRTERVQVPVAYFSFIGILLFLLPPLWMHAGRGAFAIVSIALAATLALLIFGRVTTSNKGVRDIHVWLLVGMICSILLLWFGLQEVPSGSIAILARPISEQLRAQGSLGLISLFVANALWMVVDFSTWQRVASVRKDGQDFPLSSLRRGTMRVVFESPATWCLGVVLGWTLSGILPNNTDPSLGVKTFAAVLGSGILAPYPRVFVTGFIYPVLIAASIAIMLSTVNAIISTISFTAYYDLLPEHQQGRRQTLSSLWPAKLTTIGIIIVGLVIYPFIKQLLGDNLPTFLYAAYASQLALFTIALLALLGRNLQRRAAVISLVTGLVVMMVGVGISATFPKRTELSVLPPVYAVIGSFVGYVFAYRAARPSVSPAVKP